MISIYSLVYINIILTSIFLPVGHFRGFFFPFKMWPSSEHFFSCENEFFLFGVRNFALSLVLKQSFDNSKEAYPCGPFIQSIKLKTDFFFDVIDEVLKVKSFILPISQKVES